MSGPDAMLRDAAPADLVELLVLNQLNVPHVSSLDPMGMKRLLDTARYARVIERNGGVAAALIAMTPEADYASPNFRYFRERYDSFVYCDRIMVDPSMRRQGLGRCLYDDLAAFAAGLGHTMLACEVNEQPPNPESLAFHERLGFAAVGRQTTDRGRKNVILMTKSL